MSGCRNSQSGCHSACASVASAYDAAVAFGQSVVDAVVQAYEAISACISQGVAFPSGAQLQQLAMCQARNMNPIPNMPSADSQGSIAGVISAVQAIVTDIPQMIATESITRGQCQAIFDVLDRNGQVSCLQTVLAVLPNPGLCFSSEWASKTVTIGMSASVPTSFNSQLGGEIAIYVNAQDRGCFVGVAGARSLSTSLPAPEAGGSFALFRQPADICGVAYTGEISATLFGVSVEIAAIFPAVQRGSRWEPDMGSFGLDKLIGLSGSVGADSSGFAASVGFNLGVANLVSITNINGRGGATSGNDAPNHGCTPMPLLPLIVRELRSSGQANADLPQPSADVMAYLDNMTMALAEEKRSVRAASLGRQIANTPHHTASLSEHQMARIRELALANLEDIDKQTISAKISNLASTTLSALGNSNAVTDEEAETDDDSKDLRHALSAGDQATILNELTPTIPPTGQELGGPDSWATPTLRNLTQLLNRLQDLDSRISAGTVQRRERTREELNNGHRIHDMMPSDLTPRLQERIRETRYLITELQTVATARPLKYDPPNPFQVEVLSSFGEQVAAMQEQYTDFLGAVHRPEDECHGDDPTCAASRNSSTTHGSAYHNISRAEIGSFRPDN